MKDRFGREIDYIRISVTDRCNLRCVYCMPGEGAALKSHGEILTFEETERILRLAADLGIGNVRLTGGEPLVRRDIEILVGMLAKVPGVRTLSMTTNGSLLSGVAKKLARAGLQSVNVSLDTLDRRRFCEITGRDEFGRVEEGIEAALDAGLRVKLNCAVTGREVLGELPGFARLAREKGIPVRFIEMMPVGCGRQYETVDNRVLLASLRELYPDIRREEESLGSGPAVYYGFSDSQGRVGFISAVHDKFCSSCNRVRLTADGFLRLCLSGGEGVNLRDLMRRGAEDERLRVTIEEAIRSKPEGHHFGERQSGEDTLTMNQIGG